MALRWEAGDLLKCDSLRSYDGLFYKPRIYTTETVIICFLLKSRLIVSTLFFSLTSWAEIGGNST